MDRVIVLDRELQLASATLASMVSHLELSTWARAVAEYGPTIQTAALITMKAPMTAQVLDQVEGVRLILKLGRVYDHVDLEAVRRRNAIFGLVPRKGPNCVAEHAMLLILALSKDLITAHQAVAEGAYRWRGLRPLSTSETQTAFRWTEPTRLHEVRAKTLGCVGFGEIGCELSLRARAMGMRVLYTRRRKLPAWLEERYEVGYRPLPELLVESDYVCLAVPHTPETQRLIGPAELALIGPDGFLINVARGGVVDEVALIEALRTRQIAGAALDVFTYEPLPADSPLCTLDNVILTPHIGGGTGTTYELELREALEEVDRGLCGGALQNSVTLQ